MPPEEGPRSRGRKQLLLKLGVFLLLGAIVNVAVAWGCVSYSQRSSTLYMFQDWLIVSDGPPISTLSSDRGVVYTGRTSRMVNATWGRPTRHVSDDDFAQMLPRWSVLRKGHRQPDWTIRGLNGASIAERASGWPAIACWGMTSYCQAQNLKVGLTEIPIKQYNEVDNVVVPYWPIWPGFAINTIFYAAILWLLWIAPGKVRRFIRIQRHRCPACGYEIAEGVGPRCSECGAALPASWSAKSP